MDPPAHPLSFEMDPSDPPLDVLIIDECPVIGETLSRYLRLWNCQATVVEDEEDALEFLNTPNRHVDFIIINYDMFWNPLGSLGMLIEIKALDQCYLTPVFILAYGQLEPKNKGVIEYPEEFIVQGASGLGEVYPFTYTQLSVVMRSIALCPDLRRLPHLARRFKKL